MRFKRYNRLKKTELKLGINSTLYEPCYLYCLKNKHGMAASILSMGATLYELFPPDNKGTSKNVLLTFDDITMYLNNHILYAGASLGPVAGRIQHGHLPINDRICQLTCNDRRHHIHGGYHNISLINWEETSFYTENDVAILTLKCFLPDGLDGYPGNRDIYVTFLLDDNNNLSITYEACSDKDTYLNLSNHAYFNMSGNFQENALLQYLYSPATRHTYNDAEHICLGIQSVTHTPFDFRVPCSLQDNWNAYSQNQQLRNALGYNHALVLSDSDTATPAHALTLSDAKQKYSLELYTDAPCVVLYSGGYIDDTMLLKDGIRTSASCALALEPQDIPNAPWVSEAAYKTLSANSNYRRRIIYHISSFNTAS